MKRRNPLWAAALAAGLAAVPARAAVPTLMNFQGRIELPQGELEGDDDAEGRGESRPFTGTGRFKFAIVNSSGAVLWTNVPASLTAPPPSHVNLPVADGLFNVALGDPALGMPPITPALFNEPDRFLRIFFQGEKTKGKKTKLTSERELLPAQKLLTVPFAFASGSAGSAVDAETVKSLLVGATIQGTFAVAGSLQVGGNTIILGENPATGGVPNTIAFENGDAFIKTQNPAAGMLSLETGGTKNILLSPGGNVGVGTTQPAAKLDVSGPIEYTAKNWLRFTRGTIPSDASQTTKDARCATDFGSSYVAASLGEVQVFTGGVSAPGSNNSITVSDQAIIWIHDGSSIQTSRNIGASRLACTHRLAPIRFTRASVSSSAGDAVKDAQCVVEFGSNYMTANILEIVAVPRVAGISIGDPFDPTEPRFIFVLAGETDAFHYQDPGTGAPADLTPSNFPGASFVACFHK